MMNLKARVQKIVPILGAGLRTFLRSALGVLEATRLVEGFAYLLAAVFLLAPIGFLGSSLNWMLARQSVWIGFPVVVVAAAVLLLFAAAMTNEHFLRDVQLSGMEWPSLLSIALAWFAIVVFGGLSCGFERLGVVEMSPNVPYTDGCATRYADMYLWHLFDSIPGIKFNETIGWDQRYTYSDKLSGWLVVAFKTLVIVSVIGSFVVCGRLRRERSSAANRTGTQAPEPPSNAPVSATR